MCVCVCLYVSVCVTLSVFQCVIVNYVCVIIGGVCHRVCVTVCVCHSDSVGVGVFCAFIVSFSPGKALLSPGSLACQRTDAAPAMENVICKPRTVPSKASEEQTDSIARSTEAGSMLN